MKKLFIKVLCCMLFVGVLVSGSKMEASATGKEVEAYSKYLAEQKNSNDFKYFAIVDINKDGVYELIGSEKTNKKTERWLNLVLYREGKAYPYYGVHTQDVLYAHKKQKGIRYVNNESITYETLSNNGWSSVKTLNKTTTDGKTKYFYYSGDMSGEVGTFKTISKSTYNKYLKKPWAFNAKSSGVKKVAFYKNTSSNRQKLQKGKIK